MKNLKKAVCTIFSILFLLCMMQTLTYAQKFTKNVNDETVTQIMQSIGVVTDGYEEKQDEVVTKGEFLKLTLFALGVDENVISTANKQYFFDVTEENEYFNYVGYSYKNGITLGKGDGTFGVGENMTYDVAATIALRAAGYEVYAKGNGGYLSGYAKTASENGLFDGAYTDAGENVTYKSAVRILFNMLNMDVIDHNDDYKQENETLFNRIYDIYYSEGIIESNSKTGLYQTGSKNEASIVVKGDTYKTDDDYSDIDVGLNVGIFYADEGDEYRAICISADDNEVYSLDLKDVVSYKNNEITYLTDSRSKIIKLSDSAITLVNNVPTKVPSGELKLPVYGNLKAIDNNDDGKFDVVIVSDIKLFIVSTIDTLELKLYSKEGRSGIYTLENYKEYSIVNADGTKAEFSEISENDLLQIEEASDKSRIDIVIVRNTVQHVFKGVEMQYDASGNVYYKMLNADNETVYTNTGFTLLNAGQAPQNSMKYTAVCDINGDIAGFINSESDESYVYGYLVSMATDTAVEKSYAKIYTIEGKMQTYELESKVSVKGESAKKKAALVADSVKEPQLIRYMINAEGNLSAVEFAENDRDAEGLRSIGSVTQTTTNDASRYWASSGLVGGQFAIDTNTVVFVVPPKSEIGEIDKFSVYGYADYFENSGYYTDCTGYTSIPDSVMSECVVKKWQQTVVNTAAKAMLVTRIFDYYNEDSGQVEKKIEGYLNGQLVQYGMQSYLDGTYTTEQGEVITISAGDCVRMALNKDGKADTIKLVYDMDTSTVYGTNDKDDSTNIRYGSQHRCIFGQPYKRYGDYVTMLFKGETEASTDLYNMNGQYVYTVDKNRSLKTMFEVTNAGAIRTLEEDSDADGVFVYYNYNDPKLTVIYK